MSNKMSDVLQASDLSSRFDIPIFTEEFLDQNKGNKRFDNKVLLLILAHLTMDGYQNLSNCAATFNELRVNFNICWLFKESSIWH